MYYYLSSIDMSGANTKKGSHFFQSTSLGVLLLSLINSSLIKALLLNIKTWIKREVDLYVKALTGTCSLHCHWFPKKPIGSNGTSTKT